MTKAFVPKGCGPKADSIFANRLREAMGDRSARSVAKEAGLDDAAARMILSGRSRSPTVKTAQGLASALGVSLLWLVGETDDKLAGIEPRRAHVANNSLTTRITDAEERALEGLALLRMEVGRLRTCVGPDGVSYRALTEALTMVEVAQTGAFTAAALARDYARKEG